MQTIARPEDVWTAWTDPQSICRWFTDEARGEARPGGTLVWTFRGFGEVPYRVLIAEPNRHLVLGGEIPGRGPFALEIEIRRSGGTTTLRLVNSGFLDGAAWDEEYEGVRSGWVGSLALLKHALERHPGRSRHASLMVRPAPVDHVTLYRYFGEPDWLARWLTRTGALGELGAPAALELQDGARLSGRVIASTGREKAITWTEEDDAVLELKGFAAAGRRMIGIRVTTWGSDAGRISRLEQRLTPAVERLAAQFS
jgi:uncharacterized protein YndB with AHSA1/START domain